MFVVNTLGHPEHVGGNDFLRRKYGVTGCIHKLDSRELAHLDEETLPPNITLRDGDWVEFGDAKLRVMHTSGHTPGSICLLGEKLVFTGDMLFAGGIGRTDFPGSSNSDMKSSLHNLL